MGEKTVWSKKKSGRQFPAISKWSNEIGGRKKKSPKEEVVEEMKRCFNGSESCTRGL